MRSELRGEAGRVAERVRVVIAASRAEDDDPYAPRPDERTLRGDDEPGAPNGGLLARLSDRMPVRLDPGRRPALAIAVVVLLAALATGWWVMSARPRSMPVSAAAPTVPGASPLVPSAGSGSGSSARSPSAGNAAPTAASSAVEVVVDVAGKVKRPGLYRLPPGSRVDDALTAAGGPLRGVDLTSLNLAALVTDGQQIAVGRPGAAPPVGSAGSAGSAGGGGSGGSGGSAGGLVDLNTATLDQLEALPGIGPALGQRILDYRTEHGSFGSVDQLDDVSGIGTVIFERLKPLVTV